MNMLGPFEEDSGRVKLRQARVGPGHETCVVLGRAANDALRLRANNRVTTSTPPKTRKESINTNNLQVPPRRRQLDAGHEVPVQIAEI